MYRLSYGYRLSSVLALFDERRMACSMASGTRQVLYMPSDATGEMIAPVYVADMSVSGTTNVDTGNRLSPVSIDKVACVAEEWEGYGSASSTNQDALYYSVLGLFHNAWAELWFVPAKNKPTFSLIGPCVPAELGLTDEPRLDDKMGCLWRC